ncbi:Transcriptional regulator of acetoin/glycerol metabolism [Cohaesibacter sp. ES.047]|uniref:sigma-54-dependent Fis family transcriptional regulator n=1 Tax=Cohaesibacter sp. ES.047 TaxID=1798205 RepID=UPI000BB676D3|nr:sigma-54-dependent Fis family transcriptional regulator [Cohaesibacter sp. ES.047]SNY89956.1 Transcriptional regulator of acetoin/glycerol metabolism [Cohaesibacter sp. ES.047]
MADLTLRGAALSALDQTTISASWDRCVKEHGLDQWKRHHETVVRRERVRDSIEHLGPLFTACRSQVQHIFKNIVGSGHAVILTDKSGTIVEFAVQSTLENLFRKAGLRRGADWSEAREGTNGIGTAIAEKKSITIYRDQHFHNHHASLTCTGAPVFDVDGQVLALFDVSSIGRKDDPDILAHTRALLEMSARLISRRHFQDHFSSHWVMRFHPDAERVGLLEEGLVALDHNGRIAGADQQALSHLAVSDRSDILGRDIDELIDMERDQLAAHLSDAGRVPAQVAIRDVFKRDTPLVHARLIEPEAASREMRVSGGAIAAPVRPVRHKPAMVGPSALERMVGDDLNLRDLASKASKLYEHDVPLLITGETGVGKDSFARALHEASSRKNAPFIAVNCGALPENLIEGELFGYKAGAFTGAQASGFKGQILAANGGTLLLDEIGDMPLSAQTRLLQVLERRQVTPLGSTKGIDLDIRLLAATHQPLEDLCAEGRFREDLYYRICGFVLPLPALRQRRDIAALIGRLMPGTALDDPTAFSREARNLIEQHRWPGNIRQLKHALKTAFILADGGPIQPHHLGLKENRGMDLPCQVNAAAPAIAANLRGGESGLKASLDVERRERALIEKALSEAKWNVSRCAQQLGISRNTLYRKMKSHGIGRSH